jgi:WD40 repeat protein
VKGIKANENYVTFILLTKILLFKVEANGEIGPQYLEVYHDRIVRPSAVAMASEAPVLAMTARGSWIVRVISLKSKKEISRFPAHWDTIVCVALNSSATKVATTSVNGTVVKVFTKHGFLLHELRRGMVWNADMEAIHFSHDSNWLACSNKNKTIHVFKLEEPRKAAAVEPSTWASYFTTQALAVASLPKELLRAGVSCVASMDYAFATLHIDFPGQEFLGFMPPHGDNVGFVVADQESLMLHTYKFDAHHGGECELHHSFAVDGFRSLDAPVIVSNQPDVIKGHESPLVWVNNHFD